MSTAIWYRMGGPNTAVQWSSATISGNTATWSSAADIATGYSAGDPQIALSSDGTKATAIWKFSVGADYFIQTSSATISGNAATWGATTDLSASGQNASDPQVALSSDGSRAVAVWRIYNGSNSIIETSSATINGNTASWGSVTGLSATGQNAFSAQIALSLSGDRALAVWGRSNGTNNIVQTNSMTVSGIAAVWDSVTDLSATGQSASDPQVSLSSDGDKAVAIWVRSDGTNTIVQASSAVKTEPTPTPTATPVQLPDLVVSTLTVPSSWKRGTTRKLISTIQEQGGMDAQAKVTTRLYLSTGAALKLKKATGIARFALPSIAANASVRKTLKVKLPSRIAPRKYYLFAVTDSGNSIAESDESNNTRRTPKKISVLR